MLYYNHDKEMTNTNKTYLKEMKGESNMKDSFVCPYCGGDMISIDGGFTYECDTCESTASIDWAYDKDKTTEHEIKID